MLRQVPKAMRDEDDSLAAAMCAQTGELFIFSLGVQSGSGLVSNEETDSAAHEAQECARANQQGQIKRCSMHRSTYAESRCVSPPERSVFLSMPSISALSSGSGSPQNHVSVVLVGHVTVSNPSFNFAMKCVAPPCLIASSISPLLACMFV